VRVRLPVRSYLEAFMFSSRFALVSAIALLVTACGGGYSAPSPTPSPTPAPIPTEPGSPITIPAGAFTGNRAFSPVT
jgi:hypothetical protein